MPKNNSSINNSLFDLLKGKGYSPTMLSTAGKEIPTPDEAEVFQFNFVKDGEDYGKVTLSIDNSSNLIVYYSDDIADSEKETSTETGDLSWYGLLNQLKRFAQRYQLSFELRNTDNLKSDMAKRDYMKKQDRISESKRQRVTEGTDAATQVLSDIVANEDFDALYNLMSSDTEAGKIVQRMYNDVSGEEGLHPDDDFEKILSIVLDHLTQDYGQQNMAEGNGGHAGSAKVRYTGGMHGEYDPTKKQASPQAHLDAAKYHDDEAKKYIAAMNHPKSDQKNKEWYKNIIQHHKNKADFHRQASGQQGVTEMDKSQTPPGRDGHVSHSTYGSRDKGGSTGAERTAKPVTAKQATTDAMAILNKQFKKKDVPEAKGDEYYDLTAEHVPAKAIPLIKKELAQAGITLKFVKKRDSFSDETVFEIVTGAKGLKAAKDIIWKYNNGNYVGIMNEQDMAEEQLDDSKEREENLRYSRSRNPVADAIRKKLNPNQKEQNKEKGVAEGSGEPSWYKNRLTKPVWSYQTPRGSKIVVYKKPGGYGASMIKPNGKEQSINYVDIGGRALGSTFGSVEDAVDQIYNSLKRTPANMRVDVPDDFVAKGYVQQGVAEGAPELLKKEMPLHRHAEKLLAQNGVSKDDPDYHHHLNNTIKHLRQFGNIDLINKSDKQGVAEGQESMKQVNEGYYPMGKQGSYSDAVPTTKIIIQHSRRIEEGEQRYRNIAKIFVENSDGERFAIPTTKPGLARVHARHIAEGGTPYDERGRHITALVEEYSSMSGFVRATRGKQFNESAQKLVTEGINYYQELRETLSKLTGVRGYTAYFESWTPALMEDGEEQTTNLNELFVQETLDPRIESVMPILGKLQKKLGTIKEVDALAEWADSIIEGDGGQQALNPIGIPETTDVTDDNPASQGGTRKELIAKYAKTKRSKDAEAARHAGATQSELKAAADSTEEIHEGASAEDLQSAILYRVEMRHPELVSRYGAEYVAQKALDAAQFYAGAEEVGSSDISAMVNDLVRTLKREAEHGIDENLDADQERVGQLGPTEKVGPQGAVGKLVGANESVNESEDELARILQMVKHKR